MSCVCQLLNKGIYDDDDDDDEEEEKSGYINVRLKADYMSQA